jgi:hypothetical protein
MCLRCVNVGLGTQLLHLHSCVCLRCVIAGMRHAHLLLTTLLSSVPAGAVVTPNANVT